MSSLLRFFSSDNGKFISWQPVSPYWLSGVSRFICSGEISGPIPFLYFFR